jgi:hypothetical protein
MWPSPLSGAKSANVRRNIAIQAKHDPTIRNGEIAGGNYRSLVFRSSTRMLNGAGPINEPIRTLYVDGSDDSRRAFEMCSNAAFDFSVEITAPGTEVFFHDGLLHVDFTGLDEIKTAVEYANRLYAQAGTQVADALQASMLRPGTHTRQAVEAEKEERERLLHTAMLQYKHSLP